MTEFADIASYQHGADLGVYRTAGHDRLLIKATEGTTYTTPDFAYWWAWAGRLGLGRGAYHFGRPSRSSGAAEADRFVAVLRAAGGPGPRDWVCLDAEDPDDHGNLGGRHAGDFCARMAAHGYPAGVVYSGTWYATPVGLTAAVLPVGWRRLHLATYNAAIADAAMPLPRGWSREQVVARQYTSQAVQPGIPGRSDRSRVLREWLTTGDDDMPTAKEIVDELERRVYAGMRLAETPKAGLATTNPWEVLGRTYLKAGDLQDPKMTGLAAAIADLRRDVTARVAPAPGALTLTDLYDAAERLPRAELAALTNHCVVLLAGAPGGS